MLKVIAGSAVHPDVTELNVALHGGIDTIRSLESLAPQAPRFRKRVFILDEAHQITPQAFKGALKLFEEPPRRTMFILCTTNPEKIPEEIMSRLESFRLVPVSTMGVAKRLYDVAVKEGFKPGSKENLQFLCKEIAAATGGHLREALGLLDMVHSYVHGKRGAIDWKELIPEIVEQTPEMVPYIAVQKYMQGVLKRKRALPFVAIERTHNFEYFLRRAIETWQLIFATWIDENELFDRSKGWMLKDLQFPPKEVGRKLMETTSTVESILATYTSALERIKMYATDPKAVTQVATLEVIKIWGQGLAAIK
jgi:DNA polymerase III gamma/tau subunit